MIEQYTVHYTFTRLASGVAVLGVTVTYGCEYACKCALNIVIKIVFKNSAVSGFCHKINGVF